MPETAAPPGLARFRLMGGFRLSAASGEAAPIPSRRARGLLAYLRLAPDQTASRERLCALLWSDRGEAQARASLRQCLLELKATLSLHRLDLIDAGRETLSLKPGRSGSDVADLEAALVGSAEDGLAEALIAIGEARLLDDLDIGGHYREWIGQSRARLDQAIARGVAAHLERLEARGRWTAARALAEAYLGRDPLDESVVAAAIRADVALGHATAAHRRFQVLQTALAREFGAAPGPAAREALAGIAPAPPLLVVAAFEIGEEAADAGGVAATLRDEVLSGLSRFHDLRVITDARPLTQVVAALSEEQAGSYALGASLRGGAEGRRLIVQLITSEERRVIWSRRFGLAGLDVVGAIDDIIAQVVGAVTPTIGEDLVRRPSNLPPDKVYQRFLLARGPEAKARTFAEARAAADALEAMLAADPAVALPYFTLTYLYNTDFGYTRAGSSGPFERARALELAKTALALDRGHVHGYTVAGWCYLRRRQWAAARMHFEQALALNPFHVRRVMEVGYGLLFLGDLDMARTLFDRCLLLNPSPEDGFFMDLGLLALVRGEHDLADSYFDLMADPEIWGGIFSAMNATLGGRPSPERTTAATARIAAIWPPGETMTGEAVVGWIAAHHPFHDQATEARFLAAARATFNPA